MQVEQQWADEEDEMEEAASSGPDSTRQASMAEASGSADSAIDASYVQMFVMRYLCPQEDCGGTLAPITGSDTQECNRCSHKRTDAEFMELIESLQEEDDELSD